MSLTGLLRFPQSATRSWIHQRFPLVRESARAATWQARCTPVLRPPNSVSAGLLGMAFDYRIRTLLGSVDPERTVARQGAALLRGARYQPAPPHGCKRSCRVPHLIAEPAISPAAVDEFFVFAADVLAGGGVVDGPRERELAKCCLLLAALETLFRTAAPLTELLTVALPVRNVGDMLDQVDDDWADDVTALARLVPSSLGQLAGEGRVVLNPTFAGSADVGGADGDLILRRTIVDVKARLSPVVDQLDLYQQLGYVLLDYSDAFGLREVGVYLARQALTFRWSLSELAGDRVTVLALARLRRDFRTFVRSEEVYEQRRVPRMAAVRGPKGLEPPVEPADVPAALTTYRDAMREAVRARLMTGRPAREFEAVSAPTLLFWRRDPAIITARQAQADEAAARLAEANALAEAASREALRARRAWQLDRTRPPRGSSPCSTSE